MFRRSLPVVIVLVLLSHLLGACGPTRPRRWEEAEHTLPRAAPPTATVPPEGEKQPGLLPTAEEEVATPTPLPTPTPVDVQVEIPRQLIHLPDGRGGTLQLDPNLPIPGPPARVSAYRVRLEMDLSAREAERWARRLGVLAPWVGVDLLRSPEEPPRYVALAQDGRVISVDTSGLAYVRLWGPSRSSTPPPRPEEVAQRFLAPMSPNGMPLRLRLSRLSDGVSYYDVDPVLDGMPLMSDVPWGRVTVPPEGYVSSATVWPLELEALGGMVAPPFQSLVEALQGTTPPPPLAQITSPLYSVEAGNVPIARRHALTPWQVGGTVRVIGTVWVLRGGPSGEEVRAWVRSLDGTFEIAPVPTDLIALAAADDVVVEGTLVRAAPDARWGMLAPIRVMPASPLATREGVLAVGTGGVWLISEGERVALPGAPLTLEHQMPVVVVGREDENGTFQWERIYRATRRPFSPTPTPAGAARTVVLVEPVYWLRWDRYDVQGLPQEGTAVPAWHVVVAAPEGEESLIYAMRGP